ncbi:MAG: hypothetical protein ACRCYU_05840 [Nocardioides sp.]
MGPVELVRVLEAARVLLVAAGDAADARCERAVAVRYHCTAGDVDRVAGHVVRAAAAAAGTGVLLGARGDGS